MTAADKSPKDKVITKGNILLVVGIAIIIFEVIWSEVEGRPFSIQVILVGAALCGIQIANLVGDKGEK
jgi:hypothetical protein